MDAPVSLLTALSKYLGKYEYTNNSRAAQHMLPDQQYKFQIFQRYYDSLPDCFLIHFVTFWCENLYLLRFNL